LQLLADRPMHGYEIVQGIRTATGQTLDFGEGCVYPILHRLEASRQLSSRREVVNGRSRVVYQVTEKGRKKLEESVSSWRQIVAAVNLVLQGGVHVEPATA
jgi:PadR family transcriptional regulator PadR